VFYLSLCTYLFEEEEIKCTKITIYKVEKGFFYKKMDNTIEFQQLKDRISILEHYVANIIKNNETVNLQGKKQIVKSDKNKKKKDEQLLLRMRII